MKIERLGLRAQTRNVLIDSSIVTVKNLLEMDYLQFAGIEGLGEKRQEEVIRQLESFGYDTFCLRKRGNRRGSQLWRRVVIGDIVNHMPEDQRIAAFDVFPPDFEASFDYVLTSLPNQRAVTLLRMYYEQGESMAKIADQYGITRERVYQLILNQLKEMGSPEWEPILRHGLQEVLAREKVEKEILKKLEEDSLERLKLSNSSYNLLRRMGIKKISDLLKLEYSAFKAAKGVGERRIAEIVEALEREGFDGAHLKGN